MARRLTPESLFRVRGTYQAIKYLFLSLLSARHNETSLAFLISLFFLCFWDICGEYFSRLPRRSQGDTLAPGGRAGNARRGSKPFGTVDCHAVPERSGDAGSLHSEGAEFFAGQSGFGRSHHCR